jgi:nucleoside-diphosphate-sugar epimerase
VDDAVRAFEAAGRLPAHSTINVGHPTVVSMVDLARLMVLELGADPSLVQERPLPPRMTLVKRPVLTRQRDLLGTEPAVSLEEGVRRVLDVQQRLAAEENLGFSAEKLG